MAASPTLAAIPDSDPRLIYDGDCGICTTSARWMAERVGRNEMTIASWQATDLVALGLTEADVTTAAYWVDDRGTAHRGHIGIAKALQTGSLPWSLIGRVMETPPTSWIAAGVYRVIAKNRYRLPGSTDACRLDL